MSSRCQGKAWPAKWFQRRLCNSAGLWLALVFVLYPVFVLILLLLALVFVVYPVVVLILFVFALVLVLYPVVVLVFELVFFWFTLARVL